MIWLHHREANRWELEYGGPGGALLGPLLAITRIRSLTLRREVFSGSDIGFLERFTGLEGLTVVDWKLKDAKPIERLTALRTLRLETPSLEEPVNLARFPELRELSVENAELVKGLESSTNLEQLFITRFKSEAFSSLNALRMLRIAEFSEPTFLRIGPVELPKLESLVLKAARDLEDWTGLAGLSHLRRLWLFKAPLLKSLDTFRQLGELEWLLLEDCGRIDSLNSLAQLPRLRRVNLIGNTRVMDGRVSVLLKLPNLEEVSFPSRPSYDSTEKQINDALAKRPKHRV